MSETPDISTVTDEALAERVQHGDERSLTELMRRYEPKLMRYGHRFLGGQGEDVIRQAVQDIFISSYENVEGFDTNQRFSSWIYRIAHNAFVDILRQRTKQPVFGIDFDKIISHPIHEDQYAREKENEEIRVLVEKSLGELPLAEREIIALYYFEELSYKEISDVLHIPVSTVGVRLARAREHLKKYLPDASTLPL